jgi:1,4-dihydroxy-2-naphthoate octaprenyltransferase
MKANPLVLFLQLSRPLFLAGGVLFYFLGLGIARYLGHPLDWNIALAGQVWVSALQLCVHYLNEYFDHPHDANHERRTPFSGGSGVLGSGPNQLRPQVAVLAAGTSLALVAAASTVLVLNGAVTPSVLAIMVAAFLAAILYSVPPVRLATSGYGELSTAITLAALVPAFGFALQAGGVHRLLAMSTFPLVALTLASMLSLEFADYAHDLKTSKRTLFVRAGWENGLRIHHALVLAGYLLLLAAVGSGLPAAIGLMPLLSLPLAGLQVWYMQRIGQGLKPNWTAVTFNGLAFTFLAAYLLAQGFWTR